MFIWSFSFERRAQRFTQLVKILLLSNNGVYVELNKMVYSTGNPSGGIFPWRGVFVELKKWFFFNR